MDVTWRLRVSESAQLGQDELLVARGRQVQGVEGLDRIGNGRDELVEGPVADDGEHLRLLVQRRPHVPFDEGGAEVELGERGAGRGVRIGTPLGGVAHESLLWESPAGLFGLPRATWRRAAAGLPSVMEPESFARGPRHGSARTCTVGETQRCACSPESPRSHGPLA